MNQKELCKANKIYDLLREIPLPSLGGGTQSASFGGALKYARDMSFTQSRILKLMLIAFQPKMFDEPDDEFDEIYQECTAWLEKRKKEDWQ